MLATEMLPELEKEAKKRQSESAKAQHDGKRFSSCVQDCTQLEQKKHCASADAATVFGVGSRTVAAAKKIKKEAPEKVDDIIKGKTTVDAVETEQEGAILH